MARIQLYFEKDVVWVRIFIFDILAPFILMMFTPLFIWACIWILIDENLSSITNTLQACWFIMAFFFIYSRYKTRMELWELQKWLAKITEAPTFYEGENLENLLWDIQEINIFTTQIFIAKKRFYVQMVNIFLDNLMDMHINWHIGKLLEALKNIQGNLIDRLNERKNILQGARSEVEKNLSWTPELLAVSGAQKLRIDRQIEQFEELQKRLI